MTAHRVIGKHPSTLQDTHLGVPPSLLQELLGQAVPRVYGVDTSPNCPHLGNYIRIGSYSMLLLLACLNSRQAKMQFFEPFQIDHLDFQLRYNENESFVCVCQLPCVRVQGGQGPKFRTKQLTDHALGSSRYVSR